MNRKLRAIACVFFVALIANGSQFNTWGQSASPSTKPAELTIVVLSAQKKPVAGVPVVLTDAAVENVFKSSRPGGSHRGLMRAPGEVVLKTRSNSMGEIAMPRIKEGTYAYEAGDPSQWGYANGQIEVKNNKKPLRVEIVLSEANK